MGNVFAVKDIEFKVAVGGRNTGQDNFWAIAGMESFAITFDNGIDEWSPIDARGWVKRMITSKSMTVSVAGKRVVGCAGNDYVAGLGFRAGESAATILWVTFPNGDSLIFECIVNVTASGGGASSDVAVLEFDCLSDGQPFYRRANGDLVSHVAQIDLSEPDVSFDLEGGKENV